MAQISLFDGASDFKINKPIRLIELFAGYGSQAFALKYLGVEFEHWKICEWAVKSIQAYKDAHFTNDNTDYSKDLTKDQIIEFLSKKGISANYNEPMTYEQVKRTSEDKLRQIYNNIMATHNLVNIQQVKGKDLEIANDDYCYVMTYSFPCQDLSLAGLGKGMEKGSGTRSGMLWEVERILDEIANRGGQLPQVLLMENVPEVIGANNIKHFAKWLEKLESLGYKCYWKVLNAKDYSVPQNRERCFMVSVLGDYYYNFSLPIKLEHKWKDLLEEQVDEKYFLSEKTIKFFEENSEKNKEKGNGFRFKPVEKENAEIAKTITTRSGSRMDDNFIIEINLTSKNRRLKELLNKIDLTKDQYLDVYNQTTSEILCGTITTRINEGNNQFVYKDYRIRKLTPKECFRLMGVKDQDFENIAQNQSNVSLYHLAGDSIVVDVLMAIFRKMI